MVFLLSLRSTADVECVGTGQYRTHVLTRADYLLDHGEQGAVGSFPAGQRKETVPTGFFVSKQITPEELDRESLLS